MLFGGTLTIINAVLSGALRWKTENESETALEWVSPRYSTNELMQLARRPDRPVGV